MSNTKLKGNLLFESKSTADTKDRVKRVESHGQIKLKWDADILVLNASGPFNYEGIMDALHQIQSSVEAAKLNSWKRLTILDTESLGSIEVVDVMKQNHIWVMEHGCTATAIVVRSIFQAEIFDEIAKVGNLSQKTFTDEQEAKNWLQSQP